MAAQKTTGLMCSKKVNCTGGAAAERPPGRMLSAPDLNSLELEVNEWAGIDGRKKVEHDRPSRQQEAQYETVSW
jgi:hypothetical protein